MLDRILVEITFKVDPFFYYFFESTALLLQHPMLSIKHLEVIEVTFYFRHRYFFVENPRI